MDDIYLVIWNMVDTQAKVGYTTSLDEAQRYCDECNRQKKDATEHYYVTPVPPLDWGGLK